MSNCDAQKDSHTKKLVHVLAIAATRVPYSTLAVNKREWYRYYHCYSTCLGTDVPKPHRPRVLSNKTSYNPMVLVSGVRVMAHETVGVDDQRG